MNTVVGELDAAAFMDPGVELRSSSTRRDDEWGKALARLREAQATLDAASSEPDQDAYDAVLDTHSSALSVFLALPAPDLPALAAKLDHIVTHQAWENSGSEDCLQILRHDAHRLAAAAA